MPLEALKITAYPQTGIVCDAMLPFDALLFYAAMRDRYGVEPCTASLDDLGLTAVELPLARRNAGPLWYYAASFAQWPKDCAEDTQYWHKRFDLSLAALIDPAGKKQKIKLDAFAYKAYRVPVFARHALQVDWYAVGDCQAITRLLRLCPYIGKKTSQGFGAILRWEVQPWGQDWSERGPHGELMRAIPAADGPLLGIRPPYYERANQTPCLWRER